MNWKMNHLAGLLHVQTNEMTSSPLACYVVQLVKESTSIAEVMGLTPVSSNIAIV